MRRSKRSARHRAAGPTKRDRLSAVSQRLAGMWQRDDSLLECPHHQAGAVEPAGRGATPGIGRTDLAVSAAWTAIAP